MSVTVTMALCQLLTKDRKFQMFLEGPWPSVLGSAYDESSDSVAIHLPLPLPCLVSSPTFSPTYQSLVPCRSLSL